MKYEPHPYQRMAEEHIYRTPRCGLFLEMGLGKTVVTLTALAELMFDRFEVGKALVIAPLRVADFFQWCHGKAPPHKIPCILRCIAFLLFFDKNIDKRLKH